MKINLDAIKEYVAFVVNSTMGGSFTNKPSTFVPNVELLYEPRGFVDGVLSKNDIYIPPKGSETHRKLKKISSPNTGDTSVSERDFSPFRFFEKYLMPKEDKSFTIFPIRELPKKSTDVHYKFNNSFDVSPNFVSDFEGFFEDSGVGKSYLSRRPSNSALGIRIPLSELNGTDSVDSLAEKYIAENSELNTHFKIESDEKKGYVEVEFSGFDSSYFDTAEKVLKEITREVAPAYYQKQVGHL